MKIEKFEPAGDLKPGFNVESYELYSGYDIIIVRSYQNLNNLTLQPSNMKYTLKSCFRDHILGVWKHKGSKSLL